jgi:hypothetical protein
MKPFEQYLKQKLDALPTERQPENDLWPGIDLALHAEKPHSAFSKPQRWLASAAALIVAVGLGWVLQPLWHTQNDVALNGEALVQALSQQHEQNKTTLLVSLKDTPALTNNWEEQLTELEEAAEAIKTALKEDPDNTALLRMLQSVYQQQFLLIERVHAPKWQKI